MKMAESFEWARANHKKPAGILIALAEPAEINEVFLEGPYRVRIAEKLTREEFMKRLRANHKSPHVVSALATLSGARFDAEGATDVPEPPPGMTYFYAAALIP